MSVTKFILIFCSLFMISLTFCLETETDTSESKTILTAQQIFKVPEKGTKYRIQVKLGKYFEVRLKYPTVGFNWRVDNFKGIKYWIASLNLDEEGYCKDSVNLGSPGTVGAGGYVICKFRALHKSASGIPVAFKLKGWDPQDFKTVQIRVIIN